MNKTKMITPLQSALDEWTRDCVIDPKDLDHTSQQTPNLHAKYLKRLANAKLRLRDAEFSQKTLMKQKWLWYQGKMSQEDVEELGWNPDPFDGLKILKGDMQYYVEADPELIESEAVIEMCKTTVETLKEILNNITWRHQTIKNMIETRKFEAGF